MTLKFHAHVYFDESSVESAESFRRLHQERTKELGLWVGSLVFQKVGPHPLPMFEVHLAQPTLAAYTRFIEENNPGLSILLHEDTGDDRRDHQAGARWFGKKLELDFGFFDLIEKVPSARIHKE